MSPLHRIINRARLHRDAKAQRKLAKKHAVVYRSQFFVEPLEERLLMSAEAMPLALTGDLEGAGGPSALVLTISEEPEALPIVDASVNELTIAPPLLDPDTAEKINDAGNRPSIDATSREPPQAADPVLPPLVVTSFTSTASGFTARFNRAIDTSVISLYDVEAGTFGPSDATLVGSTVGSIQGSLIVSNDLLTFVAHGGILAPDTYVVTLRSASNGIKDASGNLLDGNNDGAAGDNYINTFMVNPSSAVVIGITDFARGPGQTINVPATDAGLPISISNGAGVTSVSLTLNYDPALLRITRVNLAAGLPAGTQLVSDVSGPGVLTLKISSSTALGTGARELAQVISEVTHEAIYGAAGVLEIASVSINNGAIPSVGDDGVQAVAYFGETTGNERFSALDGQRALRVAAGLDTGFAAYAAMDPNIIADVTANGSISALDGTRILQEVAGLDREEIQPITPVIRAGLTNDTGPSASDGITSNVSIAGAVTDDGAISSFQIGLDNSSVFIDASADLVNGSFSFSRARLEQLIGAPLGDGAHTLHLRAQDDSGNTSTVADLKFILDTSAPAPALLQLLSSSDTGSRNTDGLTADATPTVRITTEPGAVVHVLVNGIAVGQGAAGTGTLEVTFPALAEGARTLTAIAIDRAGNSAPASNAVALTIDTAAPLLTLATPGANGVIAPQAHVTGSVADNLASIASARYRFDNESWHALVLSQTSGFDQVLALAGLGNGLHTLTTQVIDQAGNSASSSLAVTVTGMPFRISSLTPGEGATGVGVLVHPRINFSEAVNPATLNNSNFFASAAGAVLTANIVVDPSGLFARLFFTSPMPSRAEITVTIDGSTIHALGGGALLDADGDGASGGAAQFAFTSASVDTLPGTVMTGRIADAGPDLMPLTADDTLPGADGALGTADDILLLPLAGVKVFMRGMESVFLSSAANGVFTFAAAPAGAVTLTMQGASATAPAGFTFPELNAELVLNAGAVNDIGTIYMPRLANAVVQNVNSATNTVLTLPAEGALGLSDAERQLFTLEIAPGALLGPNGQPVAGAQVVFSLLPNETIMPFLPPTLPEPALVFTTQLRGGATDIAKPFRATFANLSGAAVGQEFTVMSFDPTTGKLVEDGTAVTVAGGANLAQFGGAVAGIAETGTLIVWDNGGEEGGLAACFHILLPKGGLGGGGVSSVSSTDCDPETTATELVMPLFLDNGSLHDYFFTNDAESFTLHFENAGAPIDPLLDPCDPVNQQASPMFIEIIVDGAATFLDGLETSTWALHPMTALDVEVHLKELLTPEVINDAVANALYGAKVDIIGTVIDPDTGLEIVILEQTLYIYRFFDIADDNHTDGRVDFERTLNDATAGVSRTKPLILHLPQEARPTIAASASSSFQFDLQPASSIAKMIFDPSGQIGEIGDTLRVSSPNGTVGNIGVVGKSVEKQTILFDKADLLFAVAHLIDSQAAISGLDDFLALFPADSDGDGMRSDEAGFGPVIDALYDFSFATLLGTFAGAGVGAAVNIADSNLGNGIAMHWNNIALDGLFPGAEPALAQATWLDISSEKLEKVVNEASTTSLPQEEYRFESVFNRFVADQRPGKWTGLVANLDSIMKYAGESFPRANAVPSLAGFASMLGNVLAHEVGHLLGGFHPAGTAASEGVYLETVMGDATSKFLQTRPWGQIFSPMLKLALGIPVSVPEHNTTYGHYRAYLDFLLNVSGSLSGVGDGFTLGAPLLTVFDGPFDAGPTSPELVIDQFAFADTIADGVGAQAQQRQLFLVNSGDQPLTLSAISLARGNAGFSIQNLAPLPIVIPAAEENSPALNRYVLTLRFDPTLAGAASDTLLLTSDSFANSGPLAIELTGTGVKPFGNLVVEVANNNLAGLRLSDATRTVEDSVTLRNDGAGALTISQINIVGGAGQFGVDGLPASFGPGSPMVLAPGGALSFDLTFNASLIGLQRAELQFVSDDGDTPMVTQRIVGTGLTDSGSALAYGDDYVALQTPFVSGAPVLRTLSGDNGNWDFSIRSGTRFDTFIFDPASGLISHAVGTSSITGEPTESLLPVFRASTAPDTDGDGLPDDIEFAIGSATGKTDTDGDGVDDFTEIALGFNPLDGVAGNTGIVAALALPGEAFDIAIGGDIAYIATGSHGLALVNIANPNKPLLLSSKDLPGFSFSVAIDDERKLAALADGSATPGLHIVNIANTSNLTILRTVPLAQPATHVEVLDEVAYVASGTALISIELQTGNILQTLDLGGATLTGLARAGRLLVTMDASNRVATVEIIGQTILLRDSLTITHGGGEVFVGNGIAYFSNESGLRGGFSTVNVADSANILLISNSDVASGFRPEQSLAVDSSGRALIGGSVPNPQNPLLSIPAIDVANVTDPANTDAYLSRFALPEFPEGVLLASGVALIADGAGDLQVINYRSIDMAAVAPTVSIQAVVNDADPTAPGIQVIAGSKLPIFANAVDDVLVRKVELLVNGSVVGTDSSFPYEGIITAPASGSFTVQARATDIGGNIGLSSLMTFQVVTDNVAPAIVSIDPANGASLPEGLQKVSVRFTEALAPASVTTSTFRVTIGGQDVTPSGIALLSGGTVVELSYSSLSAGAYQLIINGAAVTDLAGNPLAAGNVTSNFTLTADAIEWINPAGGFWDVASNWEGGVLPGVDDNVLIDVPGGVTITHRSGTTIINKLISRESLAITGGVLQVNTTVQVDGNFTIGNGGTLRNATILPGAGGQDVHVTSFANLDHVTLQANLTVDNLGTAQIQNGLTLANSRVTLASTGSTTMLLFGSDQTLGGTGEIFFGGTSNNNRDAVDGAGTLTIGSSITIRGSQNGSVGDSFTDETIILQGTILADTAGKTIILGGLNSQIQGLVHATAGSIELADSFSFVNGGAFHSDGGNVVITGTLDNTGKTLAITAATGALRSNSGTIKGGRVETSGGAALVPAFAVTLDGITLGSNLTIPDVTDVLVRNGLTLDNVGVTLTDGAAFGSPRMRFLDSSTLGGTGEVIFGGTADSNTLSGTSGFTMTIGPNVTVHGTRAGTVGGLGNLVNQGTISSDTNNNREITVSGTTVSNQGTLKATNGSDILVSGTFTNTGLIDIGASGSQVRLLAGTILQNSGETRIAGGTLIGSTVSLQGGSLSGFGAVTGALTNNATITVGGSNSAGILQVTGAYTQTATGVLNLEIGGTTQGTQFDRLQITGAATLAGILNVSLINSFAPVNAQNFAVVTYGSHGTTTFNTINGLAIGGGLAFNPTYNATNLTLTVGPSPAPGLDAVDSLLSVPLLTNDTPINHAQSPAVMNSLADSTNRRLKLDLAQSAELSKSTGKEWLFYTQPAE